MGAHLLLREVVDVGLAGADEMLGPFIKLLEMIGGEVEMVAPIEAEPANVLLDALDELVLLLGRVGVVEAQVATAAELLGDAEVEAHRLGVTDMEVAVGLGGEARDDGVVAARAHIGADDVANEIPAAFAAGALSLGHAVALRCVGPTPRPHGFGPLAHLSANKPIVRHVMPWARYRDRRERLPGQSAGPSVGV